MDCDFEITDEHEDEMVDFIQIHARSQHDMSVSEDEARYVVKHQRPELEALANSDLPAAPIAQAILAWAERSRL